MNILFAEAAAAFEELTLDNRDDELSWQEPGAWPNTFRKARFLSAVDHIQLDRLRRRVMQDMDAAFGRRRRHDRPLPRRPDADHHQFHRPSLTRDALGVSAIRDARPLVARASAHRARHADEGGPSFTVPHALCLYGRLFDEGTILRIGRALEKEFAVWDRRPPLE